MASKTNFGPSKGGESTRIGVAGASGKLGNLVLEDLLKVLPPEQLVAIVRSPEKAARFASQGVQVRRGDYSDRETLFPALAGVKRLLLISATDLGRRVEQHRAVIGAAKATGVVHIVYTSVLRADTSTLPIAAEHQETEDLLRASGLTFTILRNGWYIENYTERLEMSLAHGGFIGAAQNGKIAAATRQDYAEAAVAVLTHGGHEGKTYELAGDYSFTMNDLAEAVSGWAGKPLPYSDLLQSEYRKILSSTGLPEAIVDLLIATDVAIARGDLDSNSRDLHNLIGRNTQTLREVLTGLPEPLAQGSGSQEQSGAALWTCRRARSR
jgi:NAD(P)H dehydrogenase (quinone)